MSSLNSIFGVLSSRHPFLGFTHQVHHKEPIPQRQVCSIEDAPRIYGELIAAIVAIKLEACRKAGSRETQTLKKVSQVNLSELNLVSTI
jgi:hypothetical protein